MKPGNLETSNARVAQSAGGVPLRTGTVWVRIPPGVQEGVGRHFWLQPQKICVSGCVLPTLNGEYGVTAALQSSKLKVPVRIRLLAPQEDKAAASERRPVLKTGSRRKPGGGRVLCLPRVSKQGGVV